MSARSVPYESEHLTKCGLFGPGSRGSGMTEQPCTICTGKAVRSFTWVNASSGIGGGEQGGPMCESCMQSMWNALERYPNVRETVTICPLGGAAE